MVDPATISAIKSFFMMWLRDDGDPISPRYASIVPKVTIFVLWNIWRFPAIPAS